MGKLKFKNDLHKTKKAAVEAISAAVVSDVCRATVNMATQTANEFGLFSGVDGNKLTKIYHRRRGSKGTVVAVGPIKPGSPYSDAVYLEYGYGPVAVESGNTMVLNVAKEPYPPGYTPQEAGLWSDRFGSSEEANAQPWHDEKYEEAGGWYYNNRLTGEVSFSRGIPGFAYMGLARLYATKVLPKELSGVRKAAYIPRGGINSEFLSFSGRKIQNIAEKSVNIAPK